MSKKPIPTKIYKGEIKKTSIFDEFVLWFAMPPIERVKLAIETQGDFAKVYKVDPNTLSAWRKRPEFLARTKELIHSWAYEKTSDIVYGIYRAAIRGNPHSQKLWLQYFMGFTEKATVEHTVTQTIGVGDIRHLIEQLPEPLKTKHYENLRDLLADATAVANALSIEDRTAWDEKPAGPLDDEADNDAQDVSSASAHVLARSNTSCIRTDMVGAAHPHNHQGAERWW